MNRDGVKKGCVDSKVISLVMQQLGEYRKGHEVKQKIKEGQKYYKVEIPDEQFCYGVPNRYTMSDI